MCIRDRSENTPGLETNADNADNMYKNSEISDTDAGNEERYELEKLLLRLRERAKPVSYTHLDVYKRQTQNGIFFHALFSRYFY